MDADDRLASRSRGVAGRGGSARPLRVSASGVTNLMEDAEDVILEVDATYGTLVTPWHEPPVGCR